MIPLRDQDVLRQRFDKELTNRVRLDCFTQKPSSIFIPSRQECVYCPEVQSLAEEIAALSSKISLTSHDIEAEAKLAADLGVDKVPAIVIRGQANRAIRYFGLPSGSEFVAFIELILVAARSEPALAPESLRQLRKLKQDVRLQLLVTTVCPHSPAQMILSARIALQTPRVKLDIIEASEFLPLAQRYNLRAVPTTIIDDKRSMAGTMDEATLVQSILHTVEGKPMTTQTRSGHGSLFDLEAMLQQTQKAAPAPQRQTASGLIIPG